jgi:hypothetical protein
VTVTDPTGQFDSATANVNVLMPPPTATAPQQVLVTSSTLGASSAPVRLTWSGSAAAETFDLQQRVGSSASYTNVLVDTPARSTTQSLNLGSTYRFRARARDASDRAGPFATGPGFKIIRIQETPNPPKLVYSGTWTLTPQSSASGNAVRSSTDVGAAATLSFTGRNGAVVMPRRAALGLV